MRELSSLDQKILNLPIEKIFPVVSDFKTYNEWFPKNPELKILKTTSDYVGSIVEVKIGLVSFRIELMRINPNKEIIVQYSGAYEGRGIWYFFETINGTKLMYEIELEIKNPLVRFLSLFVNLNSIHSKMMTKIFQGLEEYLYKIYDIKPNGLNNINDTQSKIFPISSN
ncbi:MAG: SRPBCC family protein [Ignavibacteria bacterium]|nr:SRPBCC family protein [Ignavibacteria bacterium]